MTIQAPVRLRFIVSISISACCGAGVFCRSVIRPVTFLRVLSDLAQSLGISHPVQVLEAAEGAMPMTFGIARPAIFMPSDAAASRVRSPC